MNKIKMIGIVATCVSLIAQGVSSYVDKKDMIETVKAEVLEEVLKKVGA